MLFIVRTGSVDPLTAGAGAERRAEARRSAKHGEAQDASRGAQRGVRARAGVGVRAECGGGVWPHLKRACTGLRAGRSDVRRRAEAHTHTCILHIMCECMHR